MLLRETAEHVQRARGLMTGEKPENLRYAALELRMAIEAAFYPILSLYKDELGDELLREWHPRRILDALIEIDPGVERNVTISTGFSPPPGEQLRPFMVRHQRGVTPKLLRGYYHKLGFYLHAVRPHERPPNPIKLRSFLQAAATRLEEHCRETTVLVNLHPSVDIECECGRKFQRSMHAVRTTGMARCPSRECGVIFELTETESGAHAKVKQERFVCPDCQASNFFPSHRLHPGLSFACVGCKTSFTLHHGLWVSGNAAV